MVKRVVAARLTMAIAKSKIRTVAEMYNVLAVDTNALSTIAKSIIAQNMSAQVVQSTNAVNILLIVKNTSVSPLGKIAPKKCARNTSVLNTSLSAPVLGQATKITSKEFSASFIVVTHSAGHPRTL